MKKTLLILFASLALIAGPKSFWKQTFHDMIHETLVPSSPVVIVQPTPPPPTTVYWTYDDGVKIYSSELYDNSILIYLTLTDFRRHYVTPFRYHIAPSPSPSHHSAPSIRYDHHVAPPPVIHHRPEPPRYSPPRKMPGHHGPKLPRQ